MLTVASYLKVIPPGNSNPEKPALIRNFIEGVNRAGDTGVVVNTFHPMDTDVAVIPKDLFMQIVKTLRT